MRNLVKEGQVFLKNVKKLYQCILFNDLLVFAHGDSRQSIVELQLSLEAVWVEDLEDLDPQTSEYKGRVEEWREGEGEGEGGGGERERERERKERDQKSVYMYSATANLHRNTLPPLLPV